MKKITQNCYQLIISDLAKVDVTSFPKPKIVDLTSDNVVSRFAKENTDSEQISSLYKFHFSYFVAIFL